MRWLGAEPRALESRAEAAQLIERFRDRSADPRYGVWALEQRETGTVIGSVLLLPLPDGDGAVEVGWHVSNGFRWPHASGFRRLHFCAEQVRARGRVGEFRVGWPHPLDRVRFHR
ncbi:GNAT family N-acetyltransferase [Kitasatospora sp. A2-31]|uniref:GNAT family N-acetyltransferase n=1 Tax=Kitasatospora sp. A2-31 TaxID=2916414 RepID=UPI001EECCB5C|nr:GNAT family N-acetyltransferase [Kitasatospora sp. A2-31]MCG6495311.1 GNAT family N-acetyltransferase [Kitasatospora sp. A2-31]